MAQRIATTGNLAVAEAWRQINPDVVAAYPITPSTQIVEQFSQFVADGKVVTNLVTVESEHSAMSACIGAAAAGGRVMTATSSCGLALMWEMLYVAAGMRLPVLMAVANRALSAPLNIHGDHSDAMGARDAGWIQLFSENAQEAYDNYLQAVRIAESAGVRLPVMVCLDGFIISHSIEGMELLPDDKARAFVGTYIPGHPLLDVDHPVTYGAVDLQNYYTEHKRQQVEAMTAARDVILSIGREYGALTGREYGFFAPYRMEDAEVAVLALGSACGVTRETVDELRAAGVKAGMIKLRSFRPFPGRELAEACRNLKALAVLDRSDSCGAFGGPVFHETRSALFDLPQPPACINQIYGLGGRDLTMDDVRRVYDTLGAVARDRNAAPVYSYLTVRE
jgi:pyruvate ferredoxin oxidoreductase alpha subunit